MTLLPLLQRGLITLFFHRYCRWLRQLQFAVAIGIFAYMALSPAPAIWIENWSDKLLHFMGNVLLMGSTWVAFFGFISRRKTFVFALFYSLTIEGMQSFSAMRQPDALDAATNLTGIILGFFLCVLLENYLTTLQRAAITTIKP
ncbi:VanZ family protein [Teredinibacter purpureus]|jgi:VanZ like family.|uniref:VanZ family protein n=1 Tax=Teredinibacter purpureus TaxID=2731756 RepID=UPI0005F7CA3A|nr:VanZ family protein [Teredinibacter purpureus]